MGYHGRFEREKPKKKKKQSAFMRAMNEGMAQTPIQ